MDLRGIYVKILTSAKLEDSDNLVERTWDHPSSFICSAFSRPESKPRHHDLYLQFSVFYWRNSFVEVWEEDNKILIIVYFLDLFLPVLLLSIFLHLGMCLSATWGANLEVKVRLVTGGPSLPSLTILTLDVVRVVRRRGGRQVPDISTFRKKLLSSLGSPQTWNELRSLLPPIGFCRRLNKTK